jgi:hypothetical protein
MSIKTPAPISLLLSTETDGSYVVGGMLITNENGEYEFTRDDGTKFPFDNEWLGRAKPVTDELREIFGNESSVFIPLFLGNLPENADPLEYIPIGFKLPLK